MDPPLYSHQERQPRTGVVERPFHLARAEGEKCNQTINFIGGIAGGLGDGRAWFATYPGGNALEVRGP